MNKLGENNPVLYYKDQWTERNMLKELGNNVICIHRTHDTNPYKFQLFSVVVINEWDNGVPVAFLISNRAHQNVFQIFFSEIKKKTGLIEPQIFMSDGAIAFYGAWEVKMGAVEKQLLCL